MKKTIVKEKEIMTALILAIVAIACYVVSWTVPVIGIFASIAGFVLSIIAFVIGKKAVAANPADSKSKAGKIIGLILMIFGIISIIASILLIGYLTVLF